MESANLVFNPLGRRSEEALRDPGVSKSKIEDPHLLLVMRLIESIPIRYKMRDYRNFECKSLLVGDPVYTKLFFPDYNREFDSYLIMAKDIHNGDGRFVVELSPEELGKVNYLMVFYGFRSLKDYLHPRYLPRDFRRIDEAKNIIGSGEDLGCGIWRYKEIQPKLIDNKFHNLRRAIEGKILEDRTGQNTPQDGRIENLRSKKSY